MLSLETENENLSEELFLCKEEEHQLVQHLQSLTGRFTSLEDSLERVLIERTASAEENRSSEVGLLNSFLFYQSLDFILAFFDYLLSVYFPSCFQF